MNRFDYVRPASIAEAFAAFQPASHYLAAGTNLVDLMKGGAARPKRLIDITRIPGLDRIEWLADGSVRIGALVRNSDLAYDERFQKSFPSVAEALLSGASPQLRNAATVGGNLMQRTRCPYFYDVASACNRRLPRSGCDAIGGENRLHAILGWSDECIATHPSDLCVPLVALDAVVEVEGPKGARELPLDELHLLPHAAPLRETALTPGELIVAVRLPAQAAAVARHARYLKVRERTSFAFAVVSVAAGLELADGKIRTARIAMGGVAAKPWRSREAEAALVGSPPTAEAFARAAEIALAEAKPSGDNAFKIELARRLVVRALSSALEGTPQAMPALPGSPIASVSGAIHAV
ncbi:MAG: xanthine dehydrogenase family protein subunit M [Caulobacteraceae bacterium]|nr:xanthine dehydrogenase family protein subunit M [Caulobacteraceae bacterium]